MTTTTRDPATLAAQSEALAWSKARLGVTLTAAHKRLVLIELARRAYQACTDHPTNGQEWSILRSLAAGPDVESPFAELVDAYADWQACDDNPDDWRHRSDVSDGGSMSRAAAIDYTQERLDDAVDVLVGA